ncbi:helix-turn-helix domain-containing protein [Roseivirga sp. BDSF3-8]|uniref:helix-turn-helix domain-containing protein n=1 Tax=Roseivirga sp. BDSF3-8 TaxID=3241598 RepID=UPI0035327D96
MAVIQGLVLGTILISRSVRVAGKADRAGKETPVPQFPALFLGVLIILFSLILLHAVLEESIHMYNARFPVPISFGLAVGPIAYFHIRSLVHPRFRWQPAFLLHFIPSLLVDGVLFMAFFTYTANHVEWALAHIPAIQMVSLVINAFGLIQLFAYLVAGIRLHTQAGDLRPRAYHKGVKRWLKIFIRVWAAIPAFLLLVIPPAMIFIQELDQNTYLIYKPMGLLLSLAIYGLGYHYLISHFDEVGQYLSRARSMKYSVAELEDRSCQLTRFLTNEKPYLRQDLTVKSLSGLLGWPEKEVSLVIGQGLYTTFNNLINQYRVNEFLRLAGRDDTTHLSIMGIAFEAGFRSKASFYRAFKKENGLTPTEFLAQKAAS